MGEFFELVLFGEWRGYPGWNNEVAWWGISNLSRKSWNYMEQERNMTVKFDIVLCTRVTVSCYSSGSFTDERMPGDAGIKNSIEATYRKLDIQPKPLSTQLKTNLWSAVADIDDLEDFDFDSFLINPGERD
jgi:hypothetical protein